jgi:hypothetical protein
MPLRAVLLRLVLALTLVLNGIGSAAAGVRMAAPAAAPAAAMPCHEAAAPEPATMPAGTHGCCDDGLCECDCLAAATLATTVPFVAAARAEARAIHRIAAGHHAPARAPTLRPPIGPAA